MLRTKRRKPSPLRVILATAPEREAEGLARRLLEERLIACANLLPGVTSLYWWKKKLHRDAETVIVMKTPARNVAKLLKRLKALHSYDVPEFLALPVREASPEYVTWANDEAS